MVEPAHAEAILRLAEELGDAAIANNSEIHFRSASSRAYYAVFLLARARLRLKSVEEDIGVHANVIRRLRYRHKLMADRLEQMRDLRVSADYCFPVVDDRHRDWPRNWERIKGDSRWLLDQIRKRV